MNIVNVGKNNVHLKLFNFEFIIFHMFQTSFPVPTGGYKLFAQLSSADQCGTTLYSSIVEMFNRSHFCLVK